MDLIARIADLNLDTRELSFKLDFLTPEVVDAIHEFIASQDAYKISLKGVRKQSKTYEQQKKFWVDLYKIVKAKNVPQTRENIDAFYESVKKDLFPVRSVTFPDSEETIEYIPSMEDLSIEEMTNLIELLEDRYEYVRVGGNQIQVNFDES